MQCKGAFEMLLIGKFIDLWDICCTLANIFQFACMVCACLTSKSAKTEGAAFPACVLGVRMMKQRPRKEGTRAGELSF